MRTMSGRILGYDRRQVDEHLEEYRKEQEKEIFLLKDSIEACRQEREQLVKELETLRQELETCAQKGDFLGFALERVKRVVGLIERDAEDEIKRINEELNKKIGIHDRYAADIDKEIKQAKAAIEIVLQGILQLSGEKEASVEEETPARKVVGTIFSPNSKSEIVAAMGEDIIGKTVVNSSGALVGRVDDLVMDHSAREVKGFYLKGGRYVPAYCVMAVKKDSLVVSSDWQKVPAHPVDRAYAEKLESIKALLEKHNTADGQTEPEKTAGAPSLKEAGAPSLKEAGAEGQVPGSLQEEAFRTEREDSDGGFWDEDFNLDPDPAPQPAKEGWKADSPAVPRANSEDDPYLAGSQEDFFDQAMPITEEPVSPPVAVAAPGDGGRGHQSPEVPVSRRESPAVAREIKNVRYKYVVGKLAGEDLLDNDGRIIIRKSEIITPQIIEMAEKEGKLAELIVNMVIPGLEQ